MKAIGGLKRCSKCGDTKPTTEFGKDSSCVDGLRCRCKSCGYIDGKLRYDADPEKRRKQSREYSRAHPELRRASASKWAKEHPVEKAAYLKEWRATHQEQIRDSTKKWRDAHQEIVRARDRARQAAHPERGKKRGARWYRRNADLVKERARLWLSEHPEVATATRRNRRARIMAVGGTITPTEWGALLERLGNRCLCCGATSDLSLDHVIPLAKGGTHAIGNAQPLCRKCNARKHVLLGMDWRPYPSPLALSPMFTIIWRTPEVKVATSI